MSTAAEQALMEGLFSSLPPFKTNTRKRKPKTKEEYERNLYSTLADNRHAAEKYIATQLKLQTNREMSRFEQEEQEQRRKKAEANKQKAHRNAFTSFRALKNRREARIHPGSPLAQIPGSMPISIPFSYSSSRKTSEGSTSSNPKSHEPLTSHFVSVNEEESSSPSSSLSSVRENNEGVFGWPENLLPLRKGGKRRSTSRSRKTKRKQTRRRLT